MQDKVLAFEEADTRFKQAWEEFEQRHSEELKELEALREERNAKLDAAKRHLRAEAEMITSMRTSFDVGPFSVTKKWSDFYIPDKLISMLKEKDLYEKALKSKIVSQKTEIAKFEEVRLFLEDCGVLKEFECCEDGQEAGSAIFGPKSIPTLGCELSKE